MYGNVYFFGKNIFYFLLKKKIDQIFPYSLYYCNKKFTQKQLNFNTQYFLFYLKKLCEKCIHLQQPQF